MKKFLITLCMIILFGTVFYMPVTAATFKMTQEPFAYTPFATWYGNAGNSRLDYVPGVQAFAWGINVDTPFMISFVGTIDTYTASTNDYRGTLYMSGGGHLGTASGMISITKPVSLRRYVNYIAKFNGTASTPLGQNFFIVPNASMNFLYY